MNAELTEAQRHPLLTEAGRTLLRWMHEHAAAPRFNHRCGDRLTAEGLARVRAFGEAVQAWDRHCEGASPKQSPVNGTHLQTGDCFSRYAPSQ
jgi:phenylacetate-CoA ligase